MKIEIGESMMRSWLRHVKGCQIAELNWKPSTTWEGQPPEQSRMNHARAYFQDKIGKDIFGGTKSVKQLLKQGEIDVLGLRMSKSGIEEIFAVDIAFHERGINYKNLDKTVIRFLKKMVRSLLLMEGYIQGRKINLVFATPKVTPGYTSQLENAAEILRDYLKETHPSCEVMYLANADFHSEIYEPLRLQTSNVADTSELFLRSCQMVDSLVHVAPVRKKIIQPIQRNEKVMKASFTTPALGSEERRPKLELVDGRQTVHYTISSFRVTDAAYDLLCANPQAELVIDVVQLTGTHPEGWYRIPNRVAREFIEKKIHGTKWKNGFSQSDVPSELRSYFTPHRRKASA